jgi:hypothetical protein
MTNAFASYTLAADLLELRQIFSDFFAAAQPADWERRTERRASAWTLRETVAHLDAVAQAYLHCARAAQQGTPAVIPGITRRAQLAAWNRASIAARAHLPVEQLSNSFLTALYESAVFAAGLTSAELAHATHVALYDGAVSVADFLGGQLSHAGIVHGAQVAAACGAEPLWRTYRPAFMQRQLARLFAILEHAYWPERAGNLNATICFQIDGPGGGIWHMRLNNQRAVALAGQPEHADLRLRCANADLFCLLLTFRADPLTAVLRGGMRVQGNPLIGLRMPPMFLPT